MSQPADSTISGNRFIPEIYYNTIGSHPPQIKVTSGAVLVTSTLDARGWDLTGENRASPGNPMTGPIYVEGAKPGDTLAIRFDSITPNRDWGWTSNVLAQGTVDPTAAQLLPASQIVHWQINHEQQSASLKDAPDRLSELQLPLKPFLGCFGVAPSRGQAISTATSGPYGGNMDYKGFVTGVTVYLPIFTEGALLHIGDGHALQGAGEIVGTGVEISMDVQLTITVVSDHTIGWPRGESEDWIFCVGNARPLDQALQHATTEMLAWLQQDYKLSVQEASLLLGQAVEYEIANVFNPAYSVVCKLPKAILSHVNQPS